MRSAFGALFSAGVAKELLDNALDASPTGITAASVIDRYASSIAGGGPRTRWWLFLRLKCGYGSIVTSLSSAQRR
jgi:hypothetical protein